MQYMEICAYISRKLIDSFVPAAFWQHPFPVYTIYGNRLWLKSKDKYVPIYKKKNPPSMK